MFVGGSPLILLSFLWTAVEAQPVPDWFPRIRQEFDDLDAPLRACRRRNNIAPRDGSGCRANSKTCFFGDQTCGNGADDLSYPDERCVCDRKRGSRRGTWTCQPEVCPAAEANDQGQCRDATLETIPWIDNLDPRIGTDCDGFERFGFCNFFSSTTGAGSALTAGDACCACGGGARNVIGGSQCTDLPIILDPPLRWTDSVGSNCRWYAANAQRRCIKYANEMDPVLNLTVGEACCACNDITPPADAPTCTDLEGWTTADGRTCSEMTRFDCRGFSELNFAQTENFGFTPGEACCQYGGGSNNPAIPSVLNVPTVPYTSGLCSSDSSKFNMCIKISPNMAPRDIVVIDAAQSRWSSVIVADNPDFAISFEGPDASSGPFVDLLGPPTDLADLHDKFCGFDPGFPVDTIDDLNVCIRQLVNNGDPGVLATSLPVVADDFTRFGIVELNANSIRSIRDTSPTALTDLLLHELGHVLGIGTLWESSSNFTGTQLQDPDDCSYTGENANRVYQQISGCPETATVPLFGSSLGTSIDIFDDGFFLCPVHLSEQCFRTELMSPRSLSGESPLAGERLLSPITVALLEDLGYTVDYSQADAFDKSDLDPSCVCDGNTPTSNGRSFVAPQEKEPVVPEKRQLSQKGLDIITAYAEKELKARSEVAMAYMNENEGHISIGITGMMVAYMEDGEIHTRYVPNTANVDGN